MKKRALLGTIFIVLLLTCKLFAENKNDTIQTKSSLPFIVSFDTLINIKLKVHNDMEYFIQDDGANYHVDIRPNVSLPVKLGFSYRFISFNVGFSPGFIPGNNDDKLKGKTSSFSFGISTSGKILQELNLGFYKGFYLDNTKDLVPNWVEGKDEYIQLPDLKMIVFNGATGIKLNPNYSIPAIHSQTQAQLRSAGSFMPILSYDYYIIDNQKEGASNDNSQLSGNLQLIANLGYAYTLVVSKHFYVSAHIAPGIGLQHTKLITRLPEGDYTSRYTDALYRVQEKIGIGYQQNRIFAGAEAFFSQSKLNENRTNVQLKTNRNYFQVFVGYRFDTPRFIRKTTDKVKSIAPKSIQGILE